MERVEFISYSGEYPHLCTGTLVLKIDEKLVSFKDCLLSGGIVWFEDDGLEHVEEGEWSVDVPAEYVHLKKEITDVVNANVDYGCCGGCI